MADNTILIFRAPAGSFIEMPENASRKYWEIRLTTDSGQFEVLLVSDERDMIGDVVEFLDDSTTLLGEGITMKSQNDGHEDEIMKPHHDNNGTGMPPGTPRAIRYEPPPPPMTPEPPSLTDHSGFNDHSHLDHGSLETFHRHRSTTTIPLEIDTTLFGSPRTAAAVSTATMMSTGVGSNLLSSRDAFQRLELPTATPYILTGVDEPLSFLSAHDVFAEGGNEHGEIHPDDCSLLSHKSSVGTTGLSHRSTHDTMYYSRLASSSTMTASDYSSYF